VVGTFTQMAQIACRPYSSADMQFDRELRRNLCFVGV